MTDVPTFGREDLADEDKPTWDYWEALWKRRFQPPEEDPTPQPKRQDRPWL